MDAVEKATQTQLANIQKKTGRTLDELYAALRGSGKAKHGEMRDWAKAEFGLGHGDANTLVTLCLRAQAPAPAAPAAGGSGDTVLDEIYVGGKAGLRPVHEALMKRIDAFGDFEVAPKKGYVSLRRKKQFAMIGPGSQTRVDVGINHKSLAGGERLKALGPGKMTQYNVAVTALGEIDDELVGWLRSAYDAAG
jgi:hypothetical protein